MSGIIFPVFTFSFLKTSLRCLSRGPNRLKTPRGRLFRRKGHLYGRAKTILFPLCSLGPAREGALRGLCLPPCGVPNVVSAGTLRALGGAVPPVMVVPPPVLGTTGQMADVGAATARDGVLVPFGAATNIHVEVPVVPPATEVAVAARPGPTVAGAPARRTLPPVSARQVPQAAAPTEGVDVATGATAVALASDVPVTGVETAIVRPPIVLGAHETLASLRPRPRPIGAQGATGRAVAVAPLATGVVAGRAPPVFLPPARVAGLARAATAMTVVVLRLLAATVPIAPAPGQAV